MINCVANIWGTFDIAFLEICEPQSQEICEDKQYFQNCPIKDEKREQENAKLEER